jgi:hypothetical protein
MPPGHASGPPLGHTQWCGGTGPLHNRTLTKQEPGRANRASHAVGGVVRADGVELMVRPERASTFRVVHPSRPQRARSARLTQPEQRPRPLSLNPSTYLTAFLQATFDTPLPERPQIGR